MPGIINQTHKYKVYSSWYQRNERDIKYLTIHHSAWPHNSMGNEPRLHEMKGWHHKKGWPGLSYHYAIMRDGSIYKLNNHEDITWHDGRNNDTLGILVDGFFHPPHNEKPSKEQLESLDWLTTKLLDDLNLPRNRIKGHRDFGATACPGDTFYPTVLKLSKNSLNSNIMSKEPTQATWDNLKKVAGDHADHVKKVYNAQDWNMLISDYADRYEGLVWRDNRIRELETRLAEAPETSVVEQLQAKNEDLETQLAGANQEIKKLQEKVEKLEEKPETVTLEGIAEETSNKVVEKLESRFFGHAQNLGKHIETKLPRWKRTLFDSLQVVLPTVGGILVILGYTEHNIFENGFDPSVPAAWSQVIGTLTGALGIQQIDAKNKRKIEAEKINEK